MFQRTCYITLSLYPAAVLTPALLSAGLRSPAPRARPAPDGCTAAAQTPVPGRPRCRGEECRGVEVSKCQGVEVSRCRGVEVSRSVVSSDAVRGKRGWARGNGSWRGDQRAMGCPRRVPIECYLSHHAHLNQFISNSHHQSHHPTSMGDVRAVTVSKIAVMASRSSVNNGGTALTETVLAYGLVYEWYLGTDR